MFQHRGILFWNQGEGHTELIAAGREKLAFVYSGSGGVAVAVATSGGGDATLLHLSPRKCDNPPTKIIGGHPNTLIITGIIDGPFSASLSIKIIVRDNHQSF